MRQAVTGPAAARFSKLEGSGMNREVETIADDVGELENAAVYRNDRGVIAENYYELQGLAVLDGIRARHPLPQASAASLARALFQSVEIALINLNDLLERAVPDLREANFDGAVVKLFWARGFHRVLNQLGLLPARLNGALGGGATQGVLLLSDSPAFQSYLASLRALDAVVIAAIDEGGLDAEGVIADRSLESAEYNLLHLLRVCNQEAVTWEGNLARVKVDAPVTSYADFVVTDGIRACVYDRVLEGDTYFTQFRGLHQIPETLGEEANDRCEAAVLAIRRGDLAGALEQLQTVVTLIDTMAAAVPPMADNLATADYHEIRENLGLTSGSHSVCLHYHMFNDLYQQVSAEIAGLLVEPGSSDELLADRIAEVREQRFAEPRAWFIHQLVDEGLKMQALIFHWRNLHLHLPRNNLGGDMTKSLTGSPEAIKAVRHMMLSARNKDPMKGLARLHGLGGREEVAMPLTRYVESEESLDRLLLAKTGEATQARFKDVQLRLGFFANRCPFRAPARRVVGDPVHAGD